MSCASAVVCSGVDRFAAASSCLILFWAISRAFTSFACSSLRRSATLNGMDAVLSGTTPPTAKVSVSSACAAAEAAAARAAILDVAITLPPSWAFMYLRRKSPTQWLSTTAWSDCD